MSQKKGRRRMGVRENINYNKEKTILEQTKKNRRRQKRNETNKRVRRRTFSREKMNKKKNEQG